MAFNPFHTFRKHQKVIFSVLTILCMFIFVFTWGVGDISQRGKGWFGGKGGGVFVAKMYGSKVYQSDLVKWRQDRQMANLFILYLRNAAVDAIANDPRGRQEKLDPRLQDALKFLNLSPAQLQNVQQNQLFSYLFTLSQNLDNLQNELKDKSGREDERKFVEEVADALKIKQSMFFFGGDYFGAVDTYDKVLDNQLWKHQADKLGIVLTHPAVRKLLERDTAGRNVLPEGNFFANATFRTNMKGFLDRFGNQYNESQILDVLADEYRSVMAQEALVGQSLSYMGGGGRLTRTTDLLPVTYTPGEYLQYFREQRTTAKAALLPIPVDDFEKDIKTTPTAAQLRNLYNEFKDKEPDPAQPTPGFTEPRAMRVQYARINTKDEYYQNLAKTLIPSTATTQLNLAIARQWAAGHSAAQLLPLGGGAAAWLPMVGSPMATDPIVEEYGAYFKGFMSPLATGSVASGPKVAPDVYDPHYDAASALGHILGVVGQGNPFGASAAITSTTRVHTQEQARGIGAVILAGTSPAPGLGGDLTTVTKFVRPLPEIDAYLVEKARESEAQGFAIWNLTRFIKEVEDKRDKPDEAKQAVERLAKEYHFQTVTMETPKNQWQIAADPALKDLRAAFTKDRTFTDEQFASMLADQLHAVYELKTMIPDRFNPNGPPQTRPNLVAVNDHEYLLYWLVENTPAKPRSFEEAKPDVIKAWQREEARKLARKKAEEIRDKARQQSWPSDDATRQREVEAFLSKFDYGKPFVMNNIARMVERDTPNPDKEKEYQPYEVKDTDIKYAPKNFADMVVGLDKPGDATYLQNQPKTVVYVVVLLSRSEPSYDDFKRSYERASGHTGPDRIWNGFVAQQQDEFNKNFMEKMREEAAPAEVDKGKWVLPEELQQRSQRASIPEDMP